VRSHPIIIVPVHDEIGVASFDALISFLSEYATTGETDVTYLRIFRHQIGNTIGAIIHDDEFLIWIVLRLEVANRLRHKEAAICRRHHAGNERLRRIRHDAWPLARVDLGAEFVSALNLIALR
jgi:hypothetical protein